MKITTFLEALYNALSQHVYLMNRIEGIYYDPPAEAEGPYIQIGSQQDLPGRVIDESERELRQILYVWGNTSRKELFEIREDIEEALGALDTNALDGYEFYLEDCQVLPADDDGWRQLVMPYRIYL